MAPESTPEAEAGAVTERTPEVYDTYDAFLRQAIREYYARGWRSRRGNFIALVIASGQVVSMATSSLREGGGIKKAALGAAGVVALRIGLRTFFSGPVGLVLSAAMVASAVAYLARNQKEITQKIGPYRVLVDETRLKFEEIQGGYRAGRFDAAGRNLMVDGLLKRFLETVDASAPPATPPS